VTAKRLPPAHTFLARQMKDLAAKLTATLPRVRSRADDEAIHDMRVALRRLRVVLKLSRRVFGRYHVDAIRDAFTRVHRASGALRDEEVLRETLRDLELGDPQLDAWIARRGKNEERLRAIIESRLRAGHLRRPLRTLDALLALPVVPGQRRPLVVFAKKAVERAQHGVEEMRAAATPDDVLALHALRIAHKRLRYTTEIFAPALPLDVAALAKPAAHFQKRLGEVHDLDVARAVIARTRTLSQPVKTAVLAAITRKRAARIQLYLREMAAD
jgi:CHAD domain-containing protein